jgi:hypothetical protein
MTAIRQKTTVKPNGVIEVQSPELAPGERVEVIILVDKPERRKDSSVSVLEVAGRLNLDGPSDWSERFEDYLQRSRRANAGT